MTTFTDNAAAFATTWDEYHGQLVNEALNTLDDALRSFRSLPQMLAAVAHAERRLTDLGEA